MKMLQFYISYDKTMKPGNMIILSHALSIHFPSSMSDLLVQFSCVCFLFSSLYCNFVWDLQWIWWLAFEKDWACQPSNIKWFPHRIGDDLYACCCKYFEYDTLCRPIAWCLFIHDQIESFDPSIYFTMYTVHCTQCRWYLYAVKMVITCWSLAK